MLLEGVGHRECIKLKCQLLYSAASGGTEEGFVRSDRDAKSALDLVIMIGNADALLSAVKFDSKGLVPVIAQDRATGVVRMLAWANAEALRATVQSGLATFWSRSRNELWEKGKTSGNSMRVHDLRLDCDGDAILYIVDAHGPSCHTNATSCFFRSVTANGLAEDDGPAPVAAK